MDANAHRILELLGSTVERAEQVQVQQNALLQLQSAQEFAAQIGGITKMAEHCIRQRWLLAKRRQIPS